MMAFFDCMPGNQIPKASSTVSSLDLRIHLAFDECPSRVSQTVDIFKMSPTVLLTIDMIPHFLEMFLSLFGVLLLVLADLLLLFDGDICS